MLGSPTALRAARDVLDGNREIVGVYCDMVFIDGNDRPLATRRFRPSGIFDAAETLRKSILSSRNCFGIPLLNRRAACIDLRYPDGLTYVGDVQFSARAAERGPVFHIAEPLILNRFTGRNSTASVVRESGRQFDALASALRVPLSRWETLRRSLSLHVLVAMKLIFLRWARWRS
jgi:hypothetical protein